jgi:hypothetical protein
MSRTVIMVGIKFEKYIEVDIGLVRELHEQG